MDLLEVTTDSDALRNKGAVVQFKHRYRAERVFATKFFVAIHPFDDINFLVRNLNSLFGEKYSNAARIRCITALVNFHYSLLKLIDRDNAHRCLPTSSAQMEYPLRS
jgi:hypothetical protein